MAYLANKLAMFSGAGTGTLLDQSVICWGNELDMGAAHNHDDTPFVLIGGANGQLKTGQMVTFSLDLIDGDPRVRAGKDRSHNDLLLTLAKVMGQTRPASATRSTARADHRDPDLGGDGLSGSVAVSARPIRVTAILRRRADRAGRGRVTR